MISETKLHLNILRRSLFGAALLALACCAPTDRTSDGTEASGATSTSEDRGRLEACVTDLAASERERECVGRWTTTCATTGRDEDKCAHLESRLWVGILLRATPEETDLPYPEMLREIADCMRRGGQRGHCERDSAASVAISALIATESI